MTSRLLFPAEPAAASQANVRRTHEFEDQAASDRQLLRERADELLQAARQLDDVTKRAGLVLEAATLHRLATVVDEQVMSLQALDPEVAAEVRAFDRPLAPKPN